MRLYPSSALFPASLQRHFAGRETTPPAPRTRCRLYILYSTHNGVHGIGGRWSTWSRHVPCLGAHVKLSLIQQADEKDPPSLGPVIRLWWARHQQARRQGTFFPSFFPVLLREQDWDGILSQVADTVASRGPVPVSNVSMSAMASYCISLRSSTMSTGEKLRSCAANMLLSPSFLSFSFSFPFTYRCTLLKKGTLYSRNPDHPAACM